jgi:hypothetical protein
VGNHSAGRLCGILRACRLTGCTPEPWHTQELNEKTIEMSTAGVSVKYFVKPLKFSA